MKRGLQAETRLLARHLSISSAARATTAIRQAEATLDKFISLVSKEFRDSPEHTRTAVDMVFRRKALGLEAAASQRAALLSGRYPKLEPQIREQAALQTQVANKTLSGPAEKEGPERHLQILEELSSRLERLERELARQIPELGLEERLRSVDHNVVALALPEGAALVEFLRFYQFDFEATGNETGWKPARYVAFVVVVGQGNAIRMVDLGEAEPIDGMVRTFRSAAEAEVGGRAILSAPQPAAEAGWQISERLRDKLIDPLFAKQPKKPAAEPAARTRRLFLATDGELNLLPFEALRGPGGKFLTDEYEISYLGAGRDLLRVQQGTDLEAGAPVVAAEPAFALAPSSSAPDPQTHGSARRASAVHRGDLEAEGISFGPLPGTRFEGERIGRRLGVTPWMADQVLDRRMKQLRSPRVLHTATHGYFLSDQDVARSKLRESLGMSGGVFERLSGVGLANPMVRSGLALAGSQSWLERQELPEEVEDGLLTAEDVAAMDLRGTELAVLSACDTGLGEARHGEGVFGLRRGFLLAGVKTLVMSLWKVDDLAAVLLMDRFYENLIDQKMGRSDALREAQRYLRRDVTVGGIRAEWLNEEMISKLAGSNPKARERLEQWRDSPDEVRPFRDVFYWAAFILHGETGPLEWEHRDP